MNGMQNSFGRLALNLVKPITNYWRSYMLAPMDVRLHEFEARQSQRISDLLAAVRTTSQPSTTATPSPNLLDVSVLLHQSRSALLRRMPPGAQVLCSAGCAGNWYFDWVEKCYGHVNRHIGVEFYSPKPDQLPKNVEWIANTVSHMEDVADKSCDLIFSGQNLEHLWPEETIGFLLESARIIRPGGHLVVDSPNRDITTPLGWSHPEHTVELSVSEARNVITLSGFDITKSAGIWLNRDPRTQRLLPFDPNVEDEWSIPERVVTALEEPTNSFIWWIEARRSTRPPDEQALRNEIFRIFDLAWPERVQRLLIGCGSLEDRADGDWVRCDRGQSGAALFGPYMPLRAGRYEVTFTMSVEQSADPNAIAARCDVLIGSKSDPIILKDFRSDEIGKSTEVTLEFELAQLEFGVQFRCISFGTAQLMIRKRIELMEKYSQGHCENIRQAVQNIRVGRPHAPDTQSQ